MGRKTVAERKFWKVDILEVMGRIVDVHTVHFKSDFDIDRCILEAAAGKEERQDRIFLWMCRENGTWCLRERDIFLKDTREHNTFCFYAEQTSEPVLCYAVEVTGIVDGIVSGDIYTLDYQKHYEYMKKAAIGSWSVTLVYEHGERTQAAGKAITGYGDMELGKFVSFEYQPDSPKRLRELLWNERYRRDHFEDGDMEGYLAGMGCSRA